MSVKLSVTQLAHAFALARETVRRRLTDHKVEAAGRRNGHDVFELRDVVRALVHDDPEKLDPFRRKAAIQADALALRLAADRGELLAVADVRETFAAMLKLVRVALDSLPDVLERDAALTPAQVQTVERVLDRARGDLADELAAVP